MSICTHEEIYARSIDKVGRKVSKQTILYQTKTYFQLLIIYTAPIKAIKTFIIGKLLWMFLEELQ